MKIKKGDNVLVISGKDRGKKGKVISVLLEKNRIVVEKINKLVKHVRPKKQGEKGQKIDVFAPIDVSNVLVVCSKCSKPARIGVKINDSGKKFRVCKKCNETI